MKKLRGRLWLPMLAVTAVAAIYLLLRLSFARPEPPVVTLPSPAAPAYATGVPGGEEGLRRLEVTPETVRAVLASLNRADSYSREITAETFWPGGVWVQTLLVWVRGTSERIVIDGGTKNILLVGEAAYIWYDDPLTAYVGQTAARDADVWQRMESYEALLTGDVVITDAAYVTYNGEPCIFAAFQTQELGYERRLYVSVASGLLIGVETWEGDALLLRMTGSEPDISTPGDEVFHVPGIAPVFTPTRTSRPPEQ